MRTRAPPTPGPAPPSPRPSARAPDRVGRQELEYRRGGLACLAAHNVHPTQMFGRCASTTGIVPLGELVELVMTNEHYARSPGRLVDNGSSHDGARAIEWRLAPGRPPAWFPCPSTRATRWRRGGQGGPQAEWAAQYRRTGEVYRLRSPGGVRGQEQAGVRYAVRAARRGPRERRSQRSPCWPHSGGVPGPRQARGRLHSRGRRSWWCMVRRVRAGVAASGGWSPPRHAEQRRVLRRDRRRRLSRLHQLPARPPAARDFLLDRLDRILRASKRPPRRARGHSARGDATQ